IWLQTVDLTKREANALFGSPTWLSGQGLRRTRTSTPLPRHVAGPDRGLPFRNAKSSREARPQRTPEASNSCDFREGRLLPACVATRAKSLDLCFLELDVLARDGVVFAEA